MTLYPLQKVFTLIGILTTIGWSNYCLAQQVEEETYLALRDIPRLAEIGLGTEAGLSNPYLDSRNIEIYGRFFPHAGRFFAAVSAIKYEPSLNTFAKDLQDTFAEQGFEAVLSLPSWSFSVGGGLVLLEGLLNFFSSRILASEVLTSVHIGAIGYEDKGSWLMVQLNLEYSTIVYRGIAVSPHLAFLGEKDPSAGWVGSMVAGIRSGYRF